MTIVQFFVAYAVCWWLVLFMVLPYGLSMPEKPQPGHVPSAPTNPRLRRKFGITTLLAIVPAVLIYFVATAAKAEDTIYRVGSDCAPLSAHVPDADIMATDGQGAGGKKVAPANLNNESILGDKLSLNIPLEIPVDPYLDPAGSRNVDLSHSFAEVGTLKLEGNDKVLLNGKPIGGQAVLPEHCK
jgi:predicted secreted protein